MENDLISKKELLQLTGISYGQLYRWKRKMLIPEEWFIRKSTFTGQETFFPRDKILARINKIKNLKDDASLDELADILSPNPADIETTRENLLNEKIVSQIALDLFEQSSGTQQVYPFAKALYVYILDKMLQSGSISADEGKLVVQTLAEAFDAFQGQSCDLIFIRKLGISICFMVSSPAQIVFENGVKVVERVNVTSCIEELKTKLTKG
jgi:DNA-binding transcriptional MerR regulator